MFTTAWIRNTWNRIASASAARSAMSFPGTAITQTYSTAATTVPAATTHAITDSSGGAASTTAIAAQTLPTALTHSVGTADATVDDVGAAFNQTTLNNNFKEVTTTLAAIRTQLSALRDAVATLAAESELAKADILALKKVTNQVIDDLQASGIES